MNMPPEGLQLHQRDAETIYAQRSRSRRDAGVLCRMRHAYPDPSAGLADGLQTGCEHRQIYRVIIIEIHRAFVTQHVNAVRPSGHPTPDIKDIFPGSFLVRSECSTRRNELVIRVPKVPFRIIEPS